MTKINYIIVSVIFIFIAALTAFTWSLQEAYFGPKWLFVLKHLFVLIVTCVPITVITSRR